jgi:hypothetical protein
MCDEYCDECTVYFVCKFCQFFNYSYAGYTIFYNFFIAQANL